MAGTPEEALEALKGLEDQHPDLVSFVRSEVTNHILRAEDELGSGNGPQKKELVINSAGEVLKQIAESVYGEIDNKFKLGEPIDFLILNIVIPALPGLIDLLVEQMKKIGILGSGEK